VIRSIVTLEKLHRMLRDPITGWMLFKDIFDALFDDDL